MAPALSTSGDPETVARNYFAAFATGDPKQIAQFVSEDFENDHTAALGTGCVGRALYVQRLAGFLSDMVGLRYEIEQLVCDEDEVAVFYSMTARWQGSQSFEVRGAQRLVVRDGLIEHRTDYWDSASFIIQVDENAAVALRRFGIG